MAYLHFQATSEMEHSKTKNILQNRNLQVRGDESSSILDKCRAQPNKTFITN